MGFRLSKIYTRTGDKGDTGLGEGSRVPKDDPRVEAYGTVDELNSAIGLLLTADLPNPTHTHLTRIQHELFDLGGELCMPGHTVIELAYIERLETFLDELNQDLPPLKDFILPGGNYPAALCHLARTICRRTERCLVTLHRIDPLNPHSLSYLNRLSDLLFVIARVLARENGGEEVLWKHQR